MSIKDCYMPGNAPKALFTLDMSKGHEKALSLCTLCTPGMLDVLPLLFCLFGLDDFAPFIVYVYLTKSITVH